MKISQKGLYALQAMMMLPRYHHQGAIRASDIAYEAVLPEGFLALILLELKHALMVESARGAQGGYRLRRNPADIRFSEILYLMDGPLAPFGDAEQGQELIDRDLPDRAAYQLFLDMRDAVAPILDHTTLADLIADHGSRSGEANKRPNNQKNGATSVVPTVVGGAKA
jgi:Rrf2 family protein